jgi:hypothetical protein
MLIGPSAARSAITPTRSTDNQPSRIPATNRGNCSTRCAIAATVAAFDGDTPVFHATNAATDRQPVIPHKFACSISATKSTICPSIALR